MTGIGGGSLMTPLLILVFKISPPVAVATDLFFAGVTKLVGTVEYTRKKLVDWKISSFMWLGSIPASLATVAIIPENGEFVVTIQKVLSFALLLTGTVIFLRPKISRWVHNRKNILKYRSILLVLFGALLGVLVTLSSVGAGALGLAVLAVLFPERRMTELVGVDLAHTVILSFVAGLGHLAVDHVNFQLLGLLLIGSLPGVWLGSRLNWRLNERWIAAVLLLVGGWLAYATCLR
ncbi:sulfite exporter TauE/SafE family protein [Porticoccaceae bacterium LTM1]|nr:sulfite exporter TauE/SafE family protein [Porticoccaceae bacterium LTM1]